MSYDAVRKDYTKHSLEEADCLANPVDMLHQWLNEALQHAEDANAMTLSTVRADGFPDGRVVLLKSLEERGLSFYTNLKSAKAVELDQTNKAAVNFFWPYLERQVRVLGVVDRLPGEESDAYFASRPRLSQLGAWASAQSQVMTTRNQLDEAMMDVAKRFEGKTVPRPPHWGGYLLRPVSFEFWQGRASRLHDRIRYMPANEGWTMERLFP
jgi:pyridoxamine 5'-phosphate oxidase